MASIETEIWKDIKDFEGLYQVSNHGRVRSMDKYCPSKDGRKPRFRKGEVMKLYLGNIGYYTINISKGGKMSRFLVHVLVAQTFIGDKPEKHDVNHLDGVKTNNHVSNLEYCTRSENIKHATSIGLRKKSVNACKKAFPQWKCLVIHLETGIFYKSLKAATDAYNMNYKATSANIKKGKYSPLKIIDRYTAKYE